MSDKAIAIQGRRRKLLTAEELRSFIGRSGSYQAREGITFDVIVQDAREAYGRLDLLVSPVAGKGQAWIGATLIKLAQTE